MQNALAREEKGTTHKIAETVQVKTWLQFSIDGCQHMRRDVIIFSVSVQVLTETRKAQGYIITEMFRVIQMLAHVHQIPTLLTKTAKIPRKKKLVFSSKLPTTWNVRRTQTRRENEVPTQKRRKTGINAKFSRVGTFVRYTTRDVLSESRFAERRVFMSCTKSSKSPRSEARPIASWVFLGRWRGSCGLSREGKPIKNYGKCMRPTEKNWQFNKDRFDTLSIPGYVIKKNQSRDARHDQSLRQTMYHKARDMLRRPKMQRMVIAKLFLKGGTRTQKISRMCLNTDGQKNKSDNTTHLHWKTIPMKLHLKKGDGRRTGTLM